MTFSAIIFRPPIFPAKYRVNITALNAHYPTILLICAASGEETFTVVARASVAPTQLPAWAGLIPSASR